MSTAADIPEELIFTNDERITNIGISKAALCGSGRTRKAGLSGFSDGPAAVWRRAASPGKCAKNGPRRICGARFASLGKRSNVGVFLAPGIGDFFADNAAVCGVYGNQNGVEEGVAGGEGGLLRIGGAAQKPGWAGGIKNVCFALNLPFCSVTCPI